MLISAPFFQTYFSKQKYHFFPTFVYLSNYCLLIPYFANFFNADAIFSDPEVSWPDNHLNNLNNQLMLNNLKKFGSVSLLICVEMLNFNTKVRLHC